MTVVPNNIPIAPTLVMSFVQPLSNSGSGIDAHPIAPSSDVATLSIDVVIPASAMISSLPTFCGVVDHGDDGCGDDVFAW